MKENAKKYSTEVGQLLVIEITGMLGTYLAEVVEQDPLVLKVEETGPYARLKDGDYIILEEDSARAQSKDDAISTALLEEYVDSGHPLMSGLAQHGVTDGKLREILPVT